MPWVSIIGSTVLGVFKKSINRILYCVVDSIELFKTVSEGPTHWATRAKIIWKKLVKKCAPETVSTFGGEDQLKRTTIYE